MNKKIKTIFMGTADFSIPSFRALLADSRFDIVAVFTQPDKAIGRSEKLQETPVKKLALENNIPVYQPQKIADYSFYSPDNSFPIKEIDLILVIAFAQIIPQKILDIPKYGCINVHGSLLPKYRGSSCVQASILNGDIKSGVSIMKMDKGMDTGDILIQSEIILEKEETTETLFNKISRLGAEILIKTIIDYIDGKISPKKQDDSKSSLVKKTSKLDGEINWTNNAEYIEKQIRAMTTWPGAWTSLDNKILKIIKAKTDKSNFSDKKTAQIFTDNKNLLIKCGKGAISVQKIQLEGKKILSASDFINGNIKNLNKILI